MIRNPLRLPGTRRPNPCVLDSLRITEFGFLPQMATNGLSAFIKGGSKTATSKSMTLVFLFLSGISGWALLALHRAFLPKPSRKCKVGSCWAKLPGSSRRTGAVFQPFVFALTYKKMEKIVVSRKSGSIGMPLLSH